MKKFFTNQYFKAGFTLMEIVSVLAMTLLIVLAVFSLFLISQKAFNAGSDHFELSQNGRIFLDRLTRELRQTPEIVTQLPSTMTEQGFPAPAEIEFQNGHDLSDIRYLRYYVDEDQALVRQEKVYYFESEPGTYVFWNAQDQVGNPPLSVILDEKIIAEYAFEVSYFGESLTNIDLLLSKNETNLHLFTSVWGRNTRQ